MDLFFSVVIPTYNRAHILPKTIDAVLAQSFTNFELIIVDDGSADATQELITKYTISNTNIVCIHQPNSGVGTARNTGAKYAKGKYLVFLDSDDRVTERWLADFHTASIPNEPDLIFGQVMVIENGKEKIADPRDPYGTGTGVGVYLAGAFCVKRSLFFSAGQYDTIITYGENMELSWRYEALEPTYAFTDTANFYYQVANTGAGKNFKNKLQSTLYKLEKHAAKFEKEYTTKCLFLDVSGVAALRLGDYKLARKLFLQAYRANPRRKKILLRYAISWFPWLAKYPYPRVN